jgi:hypothetical protein
MTGVTVLALVGVSGCASTALPARSGGHVRSNPPTAQPGRSDLAACASVPAPSGPLARAAVVVLRAPASGRAGAELAVSVAVTARSTHARVLTVPASSAVLVLRDGKVVGRTAGATTGLIPLTLAAGVSRRAQAVPHSVRLTGCHGALPAGHYELIAVLGYRVDSLNSTADSVLGRPSGAKTFTLLSAATPVTVE